MKSVTKWFVLVVISGLLLGTAPASSSTQHTTTSFLVTDSRVPLTANTDVTTNTLIGPKKPLPLPPPLRPRPRPH
jgi:hypothetical protein